MTKRDVVTHTTEWERPHDKNVWRKSVAIIHAAGDDPLPELLSIVVVEIPGEMNPKTATVITLKVN